jgi:hypothetical protein
MLTVCLFELDSDRNNNISATLSAVDTQVASFRNATVYAELLQRVNLSARSKAPEAGCELCDRKESTFQNFLELGEGTRKPIRVFGERRRVLLGNVRRRLSSTTPFLSTAGKQQRIYEE